MVELALVFPMLMLFVCGIIDISYYTFVHATIESAARRATEQASKAPPPPNVDGSVTQDFCVAAIRSAARVGTAPLDFANSTIVVSYPTRAQQSFYPVVPTRALGSVIQVRVLYTSAWLTPVGPLFFRGASFTVDYRSRRSIATSYFGTYCATGQ